MYCAEGSKPAFSRRLALFHNFPTEAGVEQTEWIDIRPTASPIHGGAVEFNISGTGTNYIDLQRTRLYVRLRLLHEDGSILNEKEKVALINLPLHSMWNQVDISLQQQIITSSVSNNYAYKAYIDMLLKHGTLPNDPECQTQLYDQDNAGSFDDADPITGSNLGLYIRNTFTEGSKSLDLEGPIFTDICQQERFVINGVQVGIKLWPARETFCLMSSESAVRYKLQIEDCVLKCCYVKINPGVILGHSEVLLKQPAIYPLRPEMFYYRRRSVPHEH